MSHGFSPATCLLEAAAIPVGWRLKYAPDYRINLIAPFHMSEEEIGTFQTDLKEVMLYIKYSDNKNQLLNLVETDEKFHNMRRETAEVIRAITKSNFKINEKTKVVDVCVAIQELQEDSWNEDKTEGRNEGEIIGCIKTYRKFKDTDDGLLEYLLNTFKDLDEKTALDYMKTVL